MVQHKKGTSPAKRAQARKSKRAFDVNTGNDSDFDGNSGEEMVEQKTPQTRKSQVTRSMSAKNVKGEVSGKKTPGKTPLKNNSFIGKKQPTPAANGKSAAQEFKGMERNKSMRNKKPQSEEMDDDDFELDMDNGDEEEEELENIQKQSFTKQQKKGVKTPVKGADKSKKPQTPKAKTPKNKIQEKDISEDDDTDKDNESNEDNGQKQIQKQKSSSKQQKKDVKTLKGPGKSKKPQTTKAKNEIQEKDSSEDDDSDEDDDSKDGGQKQIPKQKSNSEQQRNEVKTPLKGADESKEPQTAEGKKDIDIISLFVGNLPLDYTKDELRALSSDITNVVPRGKRCCFLRFASEEKADANYKGLQGKKLKGHLLNIDYMGAKSKNSKNRDEMDLKSLYVGNLPIDVTSAMLKALSSDIKDVHMPPNFKTISYRYAFIRFASEEKADANYETLQGVKLKGQVLKIDYMGQKRWKKASLKELQVHISEIPLSATLEDVSAHFPKAAQVKFSKEFRYAFVKFLKKEDYAEALNLKEIEIDGHKLKIQEVDSSSENMRKNKRTILQGDSPAKKAKFSEN
ncbi:multiple RNA-binding domain-containing protein 1 [Trichonephila clavata]|uniref:Multiple RNA-binding domain-containing protein 1 n=1 Tax=Trichonephila clavata TaxID=2740835 RepID=A0A8X6FYY5_TRICU|nr:multiple RNA-binding domain-containing protein 1 [Trichonephila clavata]